MSEPIKRVYKHNVDDIAEVTVTWTLAPFLDRADVFEVPEEIVPRLTIRFKTGHVFETDYHNAVWKDAEKGVGE